jgi:23S rRNA (cytidine2498-2'-O)-methyltransferase
VTTAYLAAEGYEAQLNEELHTAGVVVTRRHGRLLMTAARAIDVAWAANVWFEPVEIAITSIGDAVRSLRALQRNWAMYAPAHAGRARLIAEQLPHVSAKPLVLGAPAPSAPLGSWTLLDATTVLAATRCSSPFSNGEIALVEDHHGPPSRAYLKLWEAFVRVGRWPRPGDLCLDLGASPGGWTWLLAQLGATVVAVDKAPLVERERASLECLEASAFALDPASLAGATWLFSDVIAYPERVFALVERWRARGCIRNIICTIKFQGGTDHAITRRFAAIDGAQVFHLHHNRHELTFALVER